MREIRKEESPPASDLDRDIEGEEWTKGLTEELFLDFGPKYRDYTQDW